MAFAGKNLLITGASKGLGKALVEAARTTGPARIYAVDRLPVETFDKIKGLQFDITDQSAIDRAMASMEPIDILINNAAIVKFGDLLRQDTDEIMELFRNNFLGTLRMVRAIVPKMVERKQGTIVNVLSIGSFAGQKFTGAYNATKAALMSLTQSLRCELAAHGISVHSVFPGPIDTEMLKNVQIPKASPATTAVKILQGIESGAEDIFPDVVSEAIGKMWSTNPKSVEKELGKT